MFLRADVYQSKVDHLTNSEIVSVLNSYVNILTLTDRLNLSPGEIAIPLKRFISQFNPAEEVSLAVELITHVGKLVRHRSSLPGTMPQPNSLYSLIPYHLELLKKLSEQDHFKLDDVIEVIYSFCFGPNAPFYSVPRNELMTCISNMICHIVEPDAYRLQQMMGGLLVKSSPSDFIPTLTLPARKFILAALKYDLGRFEFGIRRHTLDALRALLKMTRGSSEILDLSKELYMILLKLPKNNYPNLFIIRNFYFIMQAHGNEFLNDRHMLPILNEICTNIIFCNENKLLPHEINHLLLICDKVYAAMDSMENAFSYIDEPELESARAPEPAPIIGKSSSSHAHRLSDIEVKPPGQSLKRRLINRFVIEQEQEFSEARASKVPTYSEKSPFLFNQTTTTTTLASVAAPAATSNDANEKSFIGKTSP